MAAGYQEQGREAGSDSMKKVDTTTRAAELKTPAYIRLVKQRGDSLVVLVTPIMVGYKTEVIVMPRSLVAPYKASGYHYTILTGDCISVKVELATAVLDYAKKEAARRLVSLAAKYQAELIDVPAELQEFINQEDSRQ